MSAIAGRGCGAVLLVPVDDALDVVAVAEVEDVADVAVFDVVELGLPPQPARRTDTVAIAAPRAERDARLRASALSRVLVAIIFTLPTPLRAHGRAAPDGLPCM